MSWQEEYEGKMVTPDEAVSVIKSGDRVVFARMEADGKRELGRPLQVILDRELELRQFPSPELVVPGLPPLPSDFEAPPPPRMSALSSAMPAMRWIALARFTDADPANVRICKAPATMSIAVR